MTQLFNCFRSRDILLSTIKKFYPYLKRPTKEQQNYVYNILQIINYEPSLQYDLLAMVIDK